MNALLHSILTCASLSSHLQLFLQLPFQLLVKFVVLPTTVSFDLLKMSEHIKKRAKQILTRQSGMMRNVHASIQHMNPACRVARCFPELPVARLLISLNDGDFPKYFKNEKPSNGFLADFMQSLLETLLVVVIVSFTFIPDAAQDAILDAATNFVINAVVLGLGLFAIRGKGVWVPIVLVVGAATFLALRKLRRYSRRLVKVAIAAPQENHIEETEIEELMRNSLTLRKKLKPTPVSANDICHQLQNLEDLEAGAVAARAGATRHLVFAGNKKREMSQFGKLLGKLLPKKLPFPGKK